MLLLIHAANLQRPKPKLLIEKEPATVRKTESDGKQRKEENSACECPTYSSQNTAALDAMQRGQ